MSAPIERHTPRDGLAETASGQTYKPPGDKRTRANFLTCPRQPRRLRWLRGPKGCTKRTLITCAGNNLSLDVADPAGRVVPEEARLRRLEPTADNRSPIGEIGEIGEKQFKGTCVWMATSVESATLGRHIAEWRRKAAPLERRRRANNIILAIRAS